MQPPRIDHLVRRLTAPTSRRAALRLLVVALTTADFAVPSATDAARHRRTSCDAGLTYCKTKKKRICVDLQTEPRHCGVCRRRCASDEPCVADACTNPCGACVDEGPASCGTNGQCADGECALYAQGVECRPALCFGATLQQESVCDGAGSCLTGLLTSCPNNLLCRDEHTSCYDRCGDDSACVAGFQCDVDSGTCVPKPH